MCRFVTPVDVPAMRLPSIEPAQGMRRTQQTKQGHEATRKGREKIVGRKNKRRHAKTRDALCFIRW